MNPGDKSNSVKNDDDEEIKNVSQSKLELEKETRVNGEAERTAAKKSWQQLSDEIKVIPSEKISEEAKYLSEAIEKKVPRIETPRLERLAMYAIETGNVSHLGSVVANLEKKLKYEVANPWAYLIKTLYPLPNTDGNSGDIRKGFGAAYEANKPRPTLGGAARRHNFEAVESIHPRSTDDYFEEFTFGDESSDA